MGNRGSPAPAVERFCAFEWDIWSGATAKFETDGSAQCNIKDLQHTMFPSEASVYAELGVRRHDEGESVKWKSRHSIKRRLMGGRGMQGVKEKEGS